MRKNKDVNRGTGRNSGFTLVELIVVIVLIAVMAALTVGGILAWRDWADFNRENEYAETLFVAAQNQLNDYSADGRLEAMQKALKPDFSKVGGSTEDDNADVISRLRSVSGNKVEFGVGKNWKVYDGDSSNEHFVESGYTRDEIDGIWENSEKNEIYQDRIISIRAKKGDYNGYLSGTYSKNTEQYWVYELLSSYIYDPSILNDAAICIEFTPADGQVFSVFYSDKNEQYTYAGSSGEPEADTGSIYDVTKNNREEEIRRDRKVGYYDVEALYKATTTASRKSPVIDHVEMHNEETLYLTYEITKEPQAVNQLTYKVSLLDADKGNKPELVIEIDGTKIKGRNIGLDGDLLPLSGSLEKYTVPCKVTRYDLACESGNTDIRRASESSSASVSSGVVMDSVPVIVWSEGTDSAGNYITTGSTTIPRIHVLLDMADLNATQDKYAAYSKGIRDFYKDKRFGSSGDNSLSQDANIEDNSFTGTQSFFRFGLAPDDVFAKVEGSSTSKYKSPAPANNIDAWGRNMENTGFAESSEAAEGEEGKKRITYSVTKSRHLYNMRYIEALDYESQDIVLITTGPAAQLGYAPVAGVDYTIVRDSDNNGDIAWDKSIEKQLADKADQPLRAVSDNSIYPACERLRVNDTLFGGGNTISGLKVINEKVVEENKYTAFNPTGFINRNYGTVRDLTLDRTEVSGGDFTGGFFGVNACEATNLTMTDTCMVEGRKYVGGIAGIVLPSGNHVDHSKDTDIKKACNVYNMKTDEKQELENAEVIHKVTNYAKVTGSQAIGGIAGAVRNDYTFIKNLYEGSGEGGAMTDDELKKSFPGLYNIEDGSAVTEGNESVEFLMSECVNYGPLSCVSNDASGIGSDMTAFSGGIAGYVFDQYKTDKEKLHIVIDNCNGAPMYDDEIIKGSGGIFSSVDVFKAKATGNYVGGIAGYNYGAQISNCYSEAKDNGSSYVIGKNYVGGITGLNLGYLGGDVEAKNIKNGKITKASEKAVPGVNNNIVAGDSYVGGVTGSNSDYIYSYTDNTDLGEEGSAVIKTKPIESFDPEAIILARSEDNTISIVPKRDINLHNRVTGFINRTQVYNSGKYGGGVAGYNTGYLFNNNSIYKAAGSDDLFASTAEGNNKDYKDYTGSYIGAIAGYNNGIMGNTVRTIADDGRTSTVTAPDVKAEAISAGCFIRGNNFLGGIVGYNDSDSTIEDYNVTQGGLYGNADSSFVGGYAGFNSAPGLLMDLSADNTEDEEGSISYNGSHTIYSNIDPIIGGYFVGGDIGGNILNKKENPKINNIGVVVRSDGFFRRLTGKEFVGGYIGYNLIINNSNEDLKADDINYANKNASMIVADYLVGAIDRTERDAKEKFKANNDVVDNLSTGLKGISFYDTSDPTSYMRLYIKGQKGNAVSAMSRITGQLHVGGVIGYNDDNSMLYIEDVENATPIYAENCIENPDERTISRLVGELRVIDDGTKDYTGEVPKKAFVYSYGGGIIGRVGARTTLKNCRNAQQGLINTKGTYLGGLCEVNDGGKLISCNVSNLGYSDHDYLGGLCGLNKGVIEKCTIDGMTITGRNVVGGLTAENLGVLKNNSINNTHIRALGADIETKDKETEKHGVAGTYAGVNGASGEIVLSANRLPGSTYDIENIDVVSSGRYVGGIVGVNKGFINNDKDGFKLLYTDDYSGYSDDDMKTWLSFSGTIRGESYVGGLVGKNDIDIQGKEEAVALKYMLKGFDNYAGVIADNGTAGGIIGQTTGKSNISFCANHGDVSAPLKGNSGGIIAENSGVISFCRDFAAVSAVNGMSGGIAAINKPEGEIRNIRVEAPSGVDQSIIFESKTACGAVAAQNQGKISGININKVVVMNVKGYERASIGAIVGQNIFPASSDDKSYDYSNEEDRKKYGYIYIDGESQWDYSESTGIDSFKNTIKAAVICRSNYTNAGGIAGTNSGTITGESVGKKGLVAPSISLDGCDRANIGGIAGTNSRTIENINVDANIKGGKGNDNIGYGGIAGINTGIVRYCTFDGVLNTFGDASNPASTGGIAGINKGDALIEYCGLGVICRGDGYSKTGTNGNMTWIAAGDFYGRDYHSPDLTAYSYLGGIAGTNYGTVRDIDLAGKMQSSKNAEINSAEYVGIIGFNGTVGGIVGINRPGGKVTGYKESGEIHYLTTHGSLEAAMHGSETGSGAGGVIGIDYTGGPFEYIENNTYVQARYDVDVRAGGIIANCQPSGSKRVVMDNIVNNGSVTGYRASGGLIGELMYAGFNISNCQNYGEIRSEEGDSGGMIGTGEMLNSDCYFTSCINHGHVYVPQFAWDDSRSTINESSDPVTPDSGEGEAWDGVKTQKEYLLGDVKVVFDLTGHWSGGYNARVTMYNYGSEVIDNWTIAMDYQGTIKDFQGQAELAEKDGSVYKITCLSWNADIAPNGGSQSFAISGDGDFSVFPASFEMLGDMEQREITEFEAHFVQDGPTWDEGRMINGNIYVTNTSDSVIKDWTLSFTFNREIVGIAGATIISHNANQYTIKNNNNEDNFINPSQTLTIWIQGKGGTATDVPFNFRMMSVNPTASQTSSEHNYNGAGGMLGSYLETNGSEHVYLYDCVNTGIVERVWEKGAKPDIDNVAQNIGAFVGRGYSKQSVYRCYWHFDLCRNYNPIADTTEGFIGTSGRMAGEYFTNCFDNSALVTSSKDYSPFLTHRGDEVTMSKCYYLNDDQINFSTENYGTQFNFIRGRTESGDGIELYYGEQNYKELRSPGLFLTPPSSGADMSIQSNTGSFQLAVTNRSDSPGMESFNVYLWNDKNNDMRVKYNYSVYAVFVDANGRVATSNTEKVAATSNVARSKVSLKVPSVSDDSQTMNPHIERITVYVKLDSITSETVDVSQEIQNHNKIYMRGFTWTPKGKNMESTCMYLSDLYGLEFNIDSVNTDYTNKYLSVKKGPQDTSSRYFADLLGSRWYGGEAFYFKRSSTSSTPSITISLKNNENKFGIGYVNLYMTANPDHNSREYRYLVNARFFDGEGNAIKNSPEKSTEYHDTGWIKPGEKKRVQLVLTDTSIADSKRCKKVVITFVDAQYRSIGSTSINKSDSICFAGFTFNPHNLQNNNHVINEYLMSPESTKGSAISYNAGTSIKLFVDSSNGPGSYKVYQSSLPTHYFEMENNDPSSEEYYSDSSSYTESEKKGRNYRISTYREMDPKVLQFIREDYAFDPESGEDRLRKPSPLTCSEVGSELKFQWEPVIGAYAYEVKYRIVDIDGNKVAPIDNDYYTRQLGVQETEYSINNETAWEGKGYSVDFNVKAVSGTDSNHDSEYNEMLYMISKKVLPAPKVHLELTDDNNMAAVLDNRDDYAIRDENGNITDYIDCNVKVTYNGRGVREDRKEEYTIPVKDSRFSTQSMWVELDDEQDSTKAQILAWAEPLVGNANDYSNSSEVVSSGHLADNEELWNGDSSNDDEEYVKYKGMTYIPYGYKKRLRGFKGDDVENMKYLVQYKHFDDKNAWMRSDISEYDEDLEMWVAVTSNEAHIGAEGGHTSYNTYLENIPKEWFSEDNPTQLLVRNYLSRSENDIVLYGHDVATGIKLNGGSAEANKEILKQITNPYYITIDWDATENAVKSGEIEEIDGDIETYYIKVIENEYIWDDANNCLKDGYVLVKNSPDENDPETGEPTYSIYFNSTLYLAKKKAAYAKTKGYTDRYGNDYEYYKYDVVYKYYDTSVKETLIDYEDSTEPETVSTNAIRALEGHKEIIREDGEKVGTNYNESYQFSRTNDKYSSRIYQDTSPAPILSGGIKQGKDVNGNTTYTVRWDEFYRNEKVWNRDHLNPTLPEAAAQMEEYEYYHPDHRSPAERTDEGVPEDYYVANTWTAYANKTGYYDIESSSDRKAIMNAYYLLYSHDVSYTVDIIGITPDGDEVVVETKSFTDKDKVPVSDAYTETTYIPVDGDGHSYRDPVTKNRIYVPLYRKWAYQATFTKESDWIYDSYKIRITNNGSKYCMLEGLTDKNGNKMGVNDYTGGHIGKLNYDTPFDDVEGSESIENLCLYRLPKYREFDLIPRVPFDTIHDTTADYKTDEESGNEKSLSYTVKWSFSGFENSDQNNDLGGFLITARKKAEEATDTTVKDHYYYVEEIPNTEAVNASIDLDTATLSENGIAVRLDTVSANYVKEENTRSINIDLSDFYDGDRVDLSVTAVPRTGAGKYCDGEEGTPFELIIDSARRAPDPDKVIVESTPDRIPEYEDAENITSVNETSDEIIISGPDDETRNAVSYDTWKNGLWIGYKTGDGIPDPEDYSNDANVTINAAIAVYENAPDDSELPPDAEMTEEQIKERNAERKKAVLDSSVSWNDGAYATLYTKEVPLNMGKISDQDVVQVILGDSNDKYGTRFAGMWLKITLKATAPTGIDSRWSDQDAAGVSVNYRWIHLPYVIGVGDEDDAEGSEASTYDNFKVTSGAGDLLIEDNGSGIVDSNPGGNGNDQLMDEDQLITDPGASITDSELIPSPEPVLLPDPTTAPDNTDLLAPDLPNVPDINEDKDDGGSGDGSDKEPQNDSKDKVPNNNAGTQPEGSGDS